jgi:hypothetical protein
MSRHLVACLAVVLLLRSSMAPVSASVAGSRDGGPGASTFEQAGQPALPQVRVLDTGVAPRQLLRYRFTEGRREFIELVMTLSMTTTMEGQETAMDVPDFWILLTGTVTDLSADGVADVDEVITSADLVDPSATGVVADAMGASMEDFIGVTSHQRVDDRGHVLEGRLEMPPTIDPTAQQELQSTTDALAAMLPVFPEEAVGAGARWEVTSESSTSVVVTNVETFSLIEVTGDQLRLESSVRQSADPQPIASDTLPEGATMSLESLQGTGTGTIEVDLGSLVPVKTSASHATTVFRYSVGEDGAGLAMMMSMGATIAPARRPPSRS